MSFDGSILFLPRACSDQDLLRAARALPGADELAALLVTDETQGPPALRDAFGRYAAISAWGDADAFPDAWDEALRGLSARLPGPALALTCSDHGGVGCWQAIDSGEPGLAHWETEAYDAAPSRGLAAAFGVELAEEDLVTTLALGAHRGVDVREGRVLAPDEAEAARQELRCELLDHEEPGELVDADGELDEEEDEDEERPARTELRDRVARIERAVDEGDAKLGKELAEQALKRFPIGIENDVVRIALGEACLALDDAQGALAAVRELLEDVDDDPDALAVRGEAHLLLGDVDAARADLERAIELDPVDGPQVPRLLLLGRTLAADALEAELEDALDQSDAPDLEFLNALLRLNAGDDDGARAALTRALDTTDELAIAAVWLGALDGQHPAVDRVAQADGWPGALLRIHRGGAPRDAADPFVQEHPRRRCERHAFLGLLAERAGDPTTARAEYQAAVAAGSGRDMEHLFATLRLRALS